MNRTRKPVPASDRFGVDGLISRRSVSGSTTTFYTFDERGNVAQRLTSSAGVQNTDLYDSYGSRTGTVSQPDPWGYEAQARYYTDAETGLILCTHRFYDPNTGRFLTRDPIGYGGGINLYGYVQNDPVNRIDPKGHGTIGYGAIEVLKGDHPGTLGGAAAVCLGQTAALNGELVLMDEPDPTLGSMLRDGVGGILVGTATGAAGYGAIAAGGLLAGALGGIILSGGIDLVVIGSIALGAAIYSYTHQPKEKPKDSCTPTPCGGEKAGKERPM